MTDHIAQLTVSDEVIAHIRNLLRNAGLKHRIDDQGNVDLRGITLVARKADAKILTGV